jgi:hypothetical protein
MLELVSKNCKVTKIWPGAVPNGSLPGKALGESQPCYDCGRRNDTNVLEESHKFCYDMKLRVTGCQLHETLNLFVHWPVAIATECQEIHKATVSKVFDSYNIHVPSGSVGLCVCHFVL